MQENSKHGRNGFVFLLDRFSLAPVALPADPFCGCSETSVTRTLLDAKSLEAVMVFQEAFTDDNHLLCPRSMGEQVVLIGTHRQNWTSNILKAT